ncbi:hypothetical protein [Ilyobacter polytropus]|uniref:Uncharacterized protein n=1 Tax=Ilyobacter polytropus (strain ATCC 51220 / DSM 2926 / LMG 16218 / CuHBu1) TaxID=572544 RepID=E3H7T6_ILYPC|nr:hypothetical protein [Ilyobacter polytropus]ADO82668.1 hypothetical protein Ilyop_0882 [Ilyobacter polytropus DSM 2926]
MFTEKIIINKGAVYLLFDKDENFIGRAFIEDLSESPVKIFTYVGRTYKKDYEEIAGSISKALKEDYKGKSEMKMEFLLNFIEDDATRTITLD